MSLILENKSNSDLTSSQSLFLFILYSNPSISTVEIVKKIEEKIGDDWAPTPGARYKILKKLEIEKFIEETTEFENRKKKIIKEKIDNRKRTYKVTAKGREMVQLQIERMNIMLEFITDCCPDYFQGQRKILICKDGEC